MFAALQVLEYERDIRSRIRERLHPAQPELIEVSVKNGAPFFIVRIKCSKEGIPWANVKRMAGLCVNKMLLPEGVVPVQGSGIHSFVPEKLPAKLLFNSAYDVLSHSEKRPSEMNVSVVDFNAELAEETPRLFKLASTVRAITTNPKLYEAAAERIMDTYGATLIITDDIRSAEYSAAVISPLYTVLSGRERGMVFTLSGPDTDFGDNLGPVVTGAGIELPAQYVCLKPEDIDDYQFACALFELCGVKSLCKLEFETLFVNNEQASLYAVSKLV